MGLRFRKSFTLGPLRINISRSGVGFSLGMKGLRITRTAKGKTQATVSIRGSGISYVQDLDTDNVQDTLEDIKDFFDGNDEKEK